MPGPATFAADEGFVVRARQALDEIAESVSAMETAQRTVVAKLVELWPSAGWLAAGCRTPKSWLRTHTGQSHHEASRLEAIARLCSRSEVLCDAVVSGAFPLGWADKLARVVSDERAPFFTDDFIQALLDQIAEGLTEDVFSDILRWFKDRVDQEIKPRSVHAHTLVTSQSLFGNGEVHGSLSPVAFAAFESALESFRADPDPKGSPIQRSFGQRSADALEDLARFGLAHEGCLEDVDNDPDDTYDGMCDRDIFDELLDLDDDWDDASDWNDADDWTDGWDTADGGTDESADPRPSGPATTDTASPSVGSGGGSGVPDWDRPDWDRSGTWNPAPAPASDVARVTNYRQQRPTAQEANRERSGTVYGPREMEALRRRLRNQLLNPPHRNKRIVQPRSGVRVNMVVDPYTASGNRPLDDLDGFMLRGDGWHLTKAALEQFMCDSAIVTTAMSGGRILDANADAQQFTTRQRRAIAARDRHCVFPGCDRPPKHCDAHHLEYREDDGPTIVDNGCLLCRFHHRLIHAHDWKIHQDPDGRWIATDTHGNAWKVPRPSDSDAP